MHEEIAHLGQEPEQVQEQNTGGEQKACARCRRHSLVIRYMWAITGLLTAVSTTGGMAYQIFGS